MGKKSGKDDRTEDDSYVLQLYTTLRYSNEQFDKNVLFIASGSLGVSFAFIEKLVPDLRVAVCSNDLIKAWYCFAGVVFLSLISHFISSLSISWSIEHHNDHNWEAKRKKWNYVTRTLNIAMIFGLLSESVLLIHFINQNINDHG